MYNKKTYKTKQKELIIEYLINNKDKHVKAEEIVYSLMEMGNQVGKTTVYRCLEKLVEEGKVRKYFIEEGKGACYQYSENKKECLEHFHMKCVECGELIHLNCDYLSGIGKHVKANHNFKIDSNKTVFYGVCEKCGA